MPTQREEFERIIEEAKNAASDGTPPPVGTPRRSSRIANTPARDYSPSVSRKRAARATTPATPVPHTATDSAAEETDSEPAAELYPGVAVSDAFLCLCSFWALQQSADAKQTVAAIGYLMVGCASLMGVLRFGFIPSIFELPNRFLAAAAGRVGIPMIAMNFTDLLTEEYKFNLSAVLTVFFLLSLGDERFGDVWSTVLCAISMALIAYESEGRGSIVAGLAAFVIAALVTSDRESTILGIRRENYFHVLLGVAMVMFGLNVQPVGVEHSM